MSTTAVATTQGKQGTRRTRSSQGGRLAPATLPPELEDLRRAHRRPEIAGPETDRPPVRACAGDELGPRPVAEPSVLRLTRRGQALLTAVSILVFGSAVAVLGLRVTGVLDDRPQLASTTQIQLGAGQTLWSLARETNPGQDPARVVEEIARLNNLRSAADLMPGQVLVVPLFR